MQSGVIFGITAVLWARARSTRVECSNQTSITTEFCIAFDDLNFDLRAVLNAVYTATGVRLRKTPIDSKLLTEG